MKSKIKTLIPILVVTVVLVGGYLYFKPKKEDVIDTTPKTNQKIETVSDMIIVDYPKPHDIVTSPLVVKGRARGTWFFEGDFPITFYYGVGEDFIETFAVAEGEWMTEDFIPFTLTINFPEPYGNDGLLVLTRDNPSNMREQDMELTIPVRFR